MFFLAGSIQHRYHTREMARLGGNQKTLPILGGILAFAAMASLGLPGLAGFWGEFMALLASFNPFAGANLALFRTAMVIGAIGTVLTAGYLLWMLQRVNLGEVPEEWRDKSFHDADRFELGAWVPLVLATLAIGVYPAIVFGATNDSVVEPGAARLWRLSECSTTTPCSPSSSSAPPCWWCWGWTWWWRRGAAGWPGRPGSWACWPPPSPC